MYNSANINENVAFTEINLPRRAWKLANDGEVTIRLQTIRGRDGKIIIPIATEYKSAGWMRSSAIPGL